MNKPLKGYNFLDKDPIIDEVRTLIGKRPLKYLAESSGVCQSTLHNWFHGRTKRPMASTVRAVLRPLGYDLVIQRRK